MADTRLTDLFGESNTEAVERVSCPLDVRIEHVLEQTCEDISGVLTRDACRLLEAVYLIVSGRDGIYKYVKCDEAAEQALVKAWGRDVTDWIGRRVLLLDCDGSIRITPET